jgi:hypothetical protein
MDAARFFETLVSIYHITWHYTQKAVNLILTAEILQSHSSIVLSFVITYQRPLVNTTEKSRSLDDNTR